jgi:hypothetical protein
MRKALLILLPPLLALLTAVSIWAAPYAQGGNLYVYQFQAQPPSWYVSAASYGTLYTYAYPSSPTVTVRRLTQLYSFNTNNVWLTLANGAVYSGASYDGDNYEYRLTLTQSYSSSGTYAYTWSGNLFSFTASTSGTVSLYAKIAASSACVYNVTLVLYRDGAQVGRLTSATTSCLTSLSAGWSQVSLSVSGSHTVSAYVYVSHYISDPSTQRLTVTVEVDRVAASGAYIVNTADLSASASPVSAQQSGLQVRATYALTLSSDVDSVQVVSVSPSPASYTASYSKPTLTVTAFYNAQSQSLSSGTVSLPKPSGYTVLQYIARAPQGYYIVTNSSTPEYLDEAYALGSATALQVTFVQPSWKAVYTLAQRYVFSVLNSSSIAVGTVTVASGKYFVFVAKADPAQNCYLKLNSSLLYSAALLNNTSLAPPQAGTATITFSVQDFGAGYQVLQVSDLQGRLAGSGLIGSTGQVALNLTPYASYMLQVCKPGACKSVGLVTISSSNIQLTVMPSVPAVNPPSWASASYDYSAKALRVNVSCASPPCTVRIYKSVTWYNYWQMRLPVVLSQGWNLVFLRKSSAVSASGMWAHINASSWSEIRFGDASGLPEKFLPHSIIWSNSTHAQVLVYAPAAGTYYLYWQSQVQVPYVNITNPLIQCVNSRCGLSFDGVDDYAYVPDSPTLKGMHAVTVAAWVAVKARKTGGIVSKWSAWTPGTGGSYILWLTGLGGAEWGVVTVSGYAYTAQTTPLSLGRWYHAVGVYDGSQIMLYLDGTMPVPAVAVTGAIANTTHPLYVGRYSASYANVLIGEVRVYNCPLSATEISQIYQGASNPTSGLVLWLVADPRYLYDVNWDGYVDWQDLSGNGNHAQLVNFHARGSFANAPQRQPSNMLVITQTCNQQLCSYTVNSEDPYFTVVVTDSSGRTAQASTGLSVPLWQSPLGSVVAAIGKALNLDALGVNVNDLVIVLVGLAVMYLGFTFRNWELAVLTFGAWLTLGTLLLGGSGRLVLPGLSLALVGAALSYMLRREQQP